VPLEVEVALAAPDVEVVGTLPLPHVVWHPWRADELLSGYESREMTLAGIRRHPEEIDPEVGDDELVATLVRRNKRHHKRAVLYIHGWNDYFFQTHAADWWDELGYDFYALDLRRYGRSLRTGMMGGYIEDLSEYDLEIDAALQRVSHHHEKVVLYAHSTGGLTAALWADRHPGVLSGLVLNSPWIDLQGSALIRTLMPRIVRTVATRSATFVLPLPDNGFYARTLDMLRDGTWSYDPELKRNPSQSTRSAWLTAVMAGHDRVTGGLDIDCPILMVTSTKSDFRRRWSDGLLGVDSVLDVSRLAAKAHRLGRHVTLVRLEGAIHDIVLSTREVRERFADELRRWETAYLH
jgi:alpha-beta hydrolase superfamily lysophospholipase